jgi:hypothetical protein
MGSWKSHPGCPQPEDDPEDERLHAEAELRNMDTGEIIPKNILDGSHCKGCGKPFMDENEEVVNTVLGGGIYAWSWHVACFEATGQPLTEE